MLKGGNCGYSTCRHLRMRHTSGYCQETSVEEQGWFGVGEKTGRAREELGKEKTVRVGKNKVAE